MSPYAILAEPSQSIPLPRKRHPASEPLYNTRSLTIKEKSLEKLRGIPATLMFLEAMLLDRVLKQPVQFLRCPTYKYIHYREIGLRETAEQASESPSLRPAHAWRDRDPGPHTRGTVPARPGVSLTAPALSQSRVFADSHLPPRGGGQLRERARSNLPSSPRQPRVPTVPPPRGRGDRFCGP